MPDRNSGRQDLRGHGALGGKERAKNDYPTYIYRNRPQIEQLAAEDFQEFAAYHRAFDERKLNEFQNRSNGDWKDLQKKDEQYRAYYRDYKSTSWQQIKAEQIGIIQNALSRWDSQINAARQEYVTAYANAYLEYIEQEDAKRRPAPPKPQPTPQPQPQPAATPATPSNTLTIDGATFTVRKVDRSADEIVYYLEINHPGVTDGVEVLPLAHPISNATSTSSYGYAASFSDVSPSSSTRQASSSSDPGSSSKFSINKASKFYIKR